jgi:nitrogen fixation protein FixH
MSPTTLPTARRETGLTGRHVLIAFLTFFGIIFAVNGVLLHRALSTHGGIVANEPYRKGLEYNRRIEADERQARLGWQTNATADATGQVTVEFNDAQGQPVRGLFVSATLGRPASNREDTAIPLFESSPGRYAGSVGALPPGAWLLSVEARQGERAAGVDASADYRIKRRLWLAP